jgi:hypothetical protein
MECLVEAFGEETGSVRWQMGADNAWRERA